MATVSLSLAMSFVLGNCLITSCQTPNECKNTTIILEADIEHTITCGGDTCYGLTIYNAGDLTLKCLAAYACVNVTVYCGEFDPPGTQYNITQMTASNTHCYIECKAAQSPTCLHTELICKGNGVSYCGMESLDNINIVNSMVECDIPNTKICEIDCSASCSNSNLLCHTASACRCRPSGNCNDVTRIDITDNPTIQPTTPTMIPSVAPTTNIPTNNPTDNPTNNPITIQPTKTPTNIPSNNPTDNPIITDNPTNNPITIQPTKTPTNNPSNNPTDNPTNNPITIQPTKTPTDTPSNIPTDNPSVTPTATLSSTTSIPTIRPSTGSISVPSPTLGITNGPSIAPTVDTSSVAPTAIEKKGEDKKEERIFYLMDDEMFVMVIILIILLVVTIAIFVAYLKLKRAAKRINSVSMVASIELCEPKENINGSRTNKRIVNNKYTDKIPMISENGNSINQNEGNHMNITPNVIDAGRNHECMVDKDSEENEEDGDDDNDDMYQPTLEQRETPFTPESQFGAIQITQYNAPTTAGDV